MPFLIDIQIACSDTLPVDNACLESWVNLTLNEHKKDAELTLRLVDAEEITFLNKTWRKQDKATNVLAFPGTIPDIIELDYPFLGDIIICPSVLEQEALAQNTPLNAHWAHIVIHGVLHLLGYDHIEDNDAHIMQAMEINLLAKLDFANPYQHEGDDIE